MVAYLLYAGAALYLGVLTSISPCPLATNIAAISYVGRKVGDSRSVLAAGLLYTLGRCLLYLALAVLVTTALSIPAVSMFLQKYMHLVLAPVFLLLGMFLVGLISMNMGGAIMTEGMQKRIDTMGVWGALAAGRAFRRVVLPDIGSVVLRPDRAHHGFRERGDHWPSGQDWHQPARGVAARRHPRPAADLWHRHRAAGVAGCFSVWPIAPSPLARRTTCFPRSSGGRGRSRAGFSCWRGSVLAEVCVRGHLKMRKATLS